MHSHASLLALSSGAVALQCNSGCEAADEASGQWEVFGGPTGPFRMDSRVCKAALIAGIIDRDGGEVSVSRSQSVSVGFNCAFNCAFNRAFNCAFNIQLCIQQCIQLCIKLFLFKPNP
jgi:hypothetical protein